VRIADHDTVVIVIVIVAVFIVIGVVDIDVITFDDEAVREVVLGVLIIDVDDEFRIEFRVELYWIVGHERCS
jgi:hypothetical protein